MRAWIMGAAALLAIAAGADSRPALKPGETALAGAWRFETERFGFGCTIAGDMILRPIGGGRYDCSFVAVETCGEAKFTAKQVCTAVQEGEAVRIEASVISVSPPVSYAPDNWLLRVVGPNEMKGELRSAAVAPATFYRADPAIS